MGQHVWLLIATIATELLVITKWGKGQYTEPLPKYVKWSWVFGGGLLVLYPIIRVSAQPPCGTSAESITVRCPDDEAIYSEASEGCEDEGAIIIYEFSMIIPN
jgi:hypothetical protein